MNDKLDTVYYVGYEYWNKLAHEYHVSKSATGLVLGTDPRTGPVEMALTYKGGLIIQVPLQHWFDMNFRLTPVENKPSNVNNVIKFPTHKDIEE